MDLGLKDRVAIVGGSTRGLGRAIALAFAREGANVTICGRTESDLRRTEIEMARESSQQHVLAVPADINAYPATSAAWCATPQPLRTDKHTGDPHGLPFGGAAFRVEPTRSLPRLWMQDSSARSGSLGKAVPYMKQQHWGRIVNLLPEFSHGPFGADARDEHGETSLANANQLALVGYSKSLANELAPFNITVNNLIHGPVMTDALAVAMEERSRSENRPADDLLKEAAAAVPMGRMGKPEEVGDLAVYLASERASFITGSSVILDGGMQQEIH